MTEPHDHDGLSRSNRAQPFRAVYVPAMPPLRHSEALGRWIARLRRRRAMRRLLGVSDHLLQDIGLDRERVRRAMDDTRADESITGRGDAGEESPRG